LAIELAEKWEQVSNGGVECTEWKWEYNIIEGSSQFVANASKDEASLNVGSYQTKCKAKQEYMVIDQIGCQCPN